MSSANPPTEAEKAISSLNSAESALRASSLQSGDRLANLVKLVRVLTEMDKNGQLDAMRTMFDQLDDF